MTKTQAPVQKRLSKCLTVMLILSSCSAKKSDDGNTAAPAPQASNAGASDALPQITTDNSTKCGSVLVSNNSKIDINLCEARTQVSSMGVDTFLTSSGAASLGAKGIFISLVNYSGPTALNEGDVFKLISQRDPKYGNLVVPDGVKSWAAAAYGDGPMTNQQLQGSLSFTKVPKKTGDAFEVTFNFQSADGKVTLAGKASGVATDSTLMKPDNN